MTTQASPKIRLFVPQAFAADAALVLSDNQSHYLAQVMRQKSGDSVAVFNGADGVWRAEISAITKRNVTVIVQEKIMPQRSCPDLWLAFAPIKQYTERMIEKAVELGASHLLAVITQRAVVRSVNVEKLSAHAVEAAEQCERHDVPSFSTHKDIGSLLATWPEDRMLLHADETGGGKNLAALLPELKHKKLGVLIGPEGGFSDDERKIIAAHKNACGFGMGPRILRADTAAFSALSCIQCYAGDWDAPPRFEGTQK
ncbi:MAG: 16S rRNA (uracil(1498)-N(3))-methyltransferase [Alphaproteobacteria bacterium]|nr:16S rRNA (uracil(1498)-N(3))-methyltransferase [Alphaproteobacteria bacterium]